MVHHVATVALALVLAVLTGPAEAQYGRERVRTPVRGSQIKRPHPCEQSSCYPATGDLLIGREDRLSASSTCGLEHPERFCIAIPHLKDRKKCFFCNAKIPKQQHSVENIVHKYNPKKLKESWWQSENGVENVSIRLNLEAEFHFTHIIIRFQTFRPAAMLIERSYDFGATWQVYRYFAHNCRQSFPGAPTHNAQKLTDVICESRYSNVDPSTDGELIFRVLPPQLPIDNPYSKEVQNLLKMTNLRINFTRLHTLGDDLLDNRSEIREKYYYAIKDMVVRGSCSCYGHASRCLPLPGVTDRQDMVHGRCECTHFTKGLNCENCEDFYNDLPWKPAVGKQTNACKRCNCNNHATSCHFDEAVYERSGRVSGGVCDDCQHNTHGRNCEQCKPFFYHDTDKDITDSEACQPCDCDPAGSLDDGICDSRTDALSGDESGRCHCKANVEGRRCDRCKNGFWNFDANNPEGCQPCTCNTFGTIGNQGCNMLTGECTCKRYVTAHDCNQCLPQFWGLSDDKDGCKPCDCELGSSYDNLCDVLTGQCSCRPRVGGRTCNQPDQSHFVVYLDYLVYEAELSKASDTCKVVIREPYRDGRNSSWTGDGLMRVYENSMLEFHVNDIKKSMRYDVVVRYEPDTPGIWENVLVKIVRNGPVDPDGPCGDWRPEDDELRVQLPQNSRSSTARPSVCLEEGKTYTVLIEFKHFGNRVDGPSASILIDSIVLVPLIYDVAFIKDSSLSENQVRFYEEQCREAFNDVNFDRNNLSDICSKYWIGISTYVFEGAHYCDCNPTGSDSSICNSFGGSCSCKLNVAGRRCDHCFPGTYGFGPEGCKPCDCNSVGALNNFCNEETGYCTCRPQTYGRTCGQCEPGSWNFPHCQRCECNGHADTCDSKTGACHECRDFTAGPNCDRCIDTYYGDPRIQVNIPCRACPCPGTIESGHSYADSCALDPVTEDVVCECYEGYVGPKCETCAENYFGNPEIPGGSCSLCDCSNNTDLSRPGNCDPHTGKCLQCLYDTDGSHCQICKQGFYGDALQQNCQACRCDVLGTDRRVGSCDHHTGQCPCLPHVVGQLCDSCEENHWKIASGEGCDYCACDPVGSLSDKCNEYNGDCECKSGFGGRRCNECQMNYYGNPNVTCYACECNVIGSATQQCDRETGACICREGIGGLKCEHCDRGYSGFAPQCEPCGECFNNWDMVLDGLRVQTNKVIGEASEIQKVGTTGVYSKEFEEMEGALAQVEPLVSNTSLLSQTRDELTELAEQMAGTIEASQATLKKVEDLELSVNQRVTVAGHALQTMKDRTNELHKAAALLQQNATNLQEANVQGALNVTIQMAEQSKQAVKLAESTDSVLADAERHQRNTNNLLLKQTTAFEEKQMENQESLAMLEERMSEFNSVMPELNKLMCGQEVEGCHDLCGGAGCGFCGGSSCDSNDYPKPDQALQMAKERAHNIEKYNHQSDQILRSITQVKQNASEARSNAQDAFNFAWEARNKSDNAKKELADVNEKIWSMLSEEQSTPAMVRNLTVDVMKQKIHLEPDEIEKLTDKIKGIVVSLTNSEKILSDTSEDLGRAQKLEDDAKRAKDDAVAKQVLAGKVVLLLNDTETAQKNAEAVIEKAEQDIKLSEEDLADINREMTAAQEKARNTTASVDALNERLKQLQTQYKSNDYVVKNEISSEAQKVSEEARTVEENVRNLEAMYGQADDLLKDRVSKSQGNIERAKTLMQRASELTAATSTKFKDLEGMEIIYRDNEETLTGFIQEIDSLTKEMDDHLLVIEARSQFSRKCSS